MNDGILIDSLTLSGWRQFGEVKIDFHDRLTVLTGANGAGKSTLLKILKCHFPHETDENFLATPIQENSKTNFSLGGWLSSHFGSLFPTIRVPEGDVIGQIDYSDGTSTNLSLPPQKTMQYALKKSRTVVVHGLNITSHRVVPRYEELKQFSISGTKPADAYQDFYAIEKHYVEQMPYFRDGQHRRVNPVAALKEGLISFATFGVGNKHVSPMPELVGLYEGFQDVLRSVLPQELGFLRLEIRTPEVVVVTSSGDFPIDGASGGLMSIIQLAWQIFLQSEVYRDTRFTVLIDEPENHLHPSMQRTFLSSLVNGFPRVRFVVATHSPFIVSSVEESFVYVLRHQSADGKQLRPLDPRSVISTKLDHMNMAGPASDVLREVLGVPVTMPQWSAERLEQIANEFANEPLASETLDRLRARLSAAGLIEFFPNAVERIVK